MASIGCAITVKSGNPPIIVLSGEFNYESAPKIREALRHFIHDGCLDLAIDCQAVDFIDSSGIGAIVFGAQSLRNAGGIMRLYSVTPQLMHALQISGFARFFEIDSTIDRANVVLPECNTLTQSRHYSSMMVPIRMDSDASVRSRVVELANCMPFNEDQIDDIRLAVGEAVSNAIRHGCKDKEQDQIFVQCMGDHEKLVLEVHNPGEPFDPNAVPIPNPCHPREGGMGIFFMRATMDLVEYNFDETGTTVRMVKYIK